MSSTTHDDLMKYFRSRPFGGAKDGKHFCYSPLDEILSGAKDWFGANDLELEKMKEWYTNYDDYISGADSCYELTDRLKGIWKGSVDARHRHFGIGMREDNEYDKLVDKFENEVFRKMILTDHIPWLPCDSLEFGALDNICQTILDFTNTMKKSGAKVGNLYTDHNNVYWALHSLNLMGQRGELDPDIIGMGECHCFKI